MTTKATTTTSTDARECAEIKALILWCRDQRIAVSEAQVGMTRLVLSDLTLAGTLAPPRRTDEELRQNLIAQYGGEALLEMTKEEEPVYEGEEAEVDE